jgi:hypothetical protein
MFEVGPIDRGRNHVCIENFQLGFRTDKPSPRMPSDRNGLDHGHVFRGGNDAGQPEAMVSDARETQEPTII